MAERRREAASLHTGFDPKVIIRRLCDVLDRENAAPAAAPPPPEPLVARLAAAVGVPRPWQHIADPERARGCFAAQARRLFGTARDPLALVEREERVAARWATAISTTNPKGSPQ
jgi:hypothetical protein